MRFASNALTAAAIAAVLSSLAVAVLMLHRGLEVHVPVDMPPPEVLSAMSDLELCQLEQRTITGLAALRELGVDGFLFIYGPTRCTVFVAVVLGCFIFSRVTRSGLQRQAAPVSTRTPCALAILTMLSLAPAWSASADPAESRGTAEAGASAPFSYVIEDGKLVGIRANRVKEGTVLAKAGLQPGDVILAINGTLVSADSSAAAALLSELVVAPSLTLTVRTSSGEIKELRYLFEDGDET